MLGDVNVWISMQDTQPMSPHLGIGGWGGGWVFVCSQDIVSVPSHIYVVILGHYSLTLFVFAWSYLDFVINAHLVALG